MTTAPALYIPKKKVVIASSFEGVVNNGAKECAFVSYNAYHKMKEKGQLDGYRSMFGRQLTMEEFRSDWHIGNGLEVGNFLALRPLVAVAGDYLNVIMLAGKYYSSATYNPENLTEEFRDLVAHTTNERKIFTEEFYAERKFQQEKDYRGWLALQEPYMDTLEQLRILNSLKAQTLEKGYTGFALYYVTSKDEASTYQLCTVYGEFNLFKEGEVGGINFDKEKDWPKYFQNLQTCLITPDRIVGKDKVAGADKVKQMLLVAEQEGIPRSQVFRVQDRFDETEIRELKEAGFEHQFIVTGGYAFPSDYKKAEKAGIPVIPKNEMAKFFSEFASEKGY